ncbi:MAG: glutaredoxin family protein [Pseudomonadales bacterium]
MKAKLYTTVGCHLCDQALAMLNGLAATDLPLDIECVDIADSAPLMADYGERIPVIRVEGRDDELGWPFGMDELKTFLGTTP